MSGVQDIETAIGHHDPLAVGTRVRDHREQLVFGQGATPRLIVFMQGTPQFRHADGRGAELADHDARRQVGQRGRLGQFGTGGERSRQGRDDGIAGTGDIEHLARTRPQVNGFLPRTDEGHAVLAPGNQHRLDAAVPAQGGRPFDEFLIGRAASDDALEFAQVGRDQAGAPIGCEITSLRIDDHGTTRTAGGLDQRAGIAQCALRVIGQNHCPAPFEQWLVQGQQVARLDAREAVLEIQANELLVPTDHAQLADRGGIVELPEVAVDAGRFEEPGQFRTGEILAGDPDQRRPAPECRDIERDVARATRALFHAADMDHGDRRLGRDAIGAAVPVPVEHQVADHQDARPVKIRQGDLHAVSLRSGPDVLGCMDGTGGALPVR